MSVQKGSFLGVVRGRIIDLKQDCKYFLKKMSGGGLDLNANLEIIALVAIDVISILFTKEWENIRCLVCRNTPKPVSTE